MTIRGDRIRRRFLGSGAFLLLAAAAPDPKLARLTAALAEATDHDQAMQAELELEAIRQRALPPTVRLLVRRAQRERGEGDPRAALADLDDAMTLQPDNALLWREHATGSAGIGDLDGAVRDLGGAISRDPSDLLAWQTLAGIEAQRGDWMAAYKAWQHAITLDPMLPDGHKRLDRLRRKAFGQPA